MCPVSCSINSDSKVVGSCSIPLPTLLQILCYSSSISLFFFYFPVSMTNYPPSNLLGFLVRQHCLYCTLLIVILHAESGTPHILFKHNSKYLTTQVTTVGFPAPSCTLPLAVHEDCKGLACYCSVIRAITTSPCMYHRIPGALLLPENNISPESTFLKTPVVFTFQA